MEIGNLQWTMIRFGGNALQSPAATAPFRKEPFGVQLPGSPMSKGGQGSRACGNAARPLRIVGNPRDPDGKLPTALLQQVSIAHCKLSGFRPAAERETRSGAGRSQISVRFSLRIPAHGGASQGRWLRGGRGCRGRSPRPRRWRAPVRKRPACRLQRRSACRAHPFRLRCG